MARNVLVDVNNVLMNINQGSEPVAKKLADMHNSGVALYYDEQGFREAVINNQLDGAANRQTLENLGFQSAPRNNPNRRADFFRMNSAPGRVAIIQDGASIQPNPDKESKDKTVIVDGKKGIGNLRDSALAATAYENDFEIFSNDGTFARPGQRQDELRSAFTGKFDLLELDSKGEPIKDANNAYVKTTVVGSGLRIAPESTELFGVKPPNNRTNPNVGRRLLGLGPVSEAGRGKVVGPLNPGTPGMANHEETQTKMMGGILALGVIISWLDDYIIEESMKKDVTEWEDYIRKRQPLDPENGFMLVAIIKKWQPRDAAYATRSYVSMEMFEGYTRDQADQMAMKNILPGLIPPTETVSYTYVKMWIAPLRPRAVLTRDQSDEKSYGKESWYPRYRLVRHSLEPPADYGEALSALQASSMYDILRVLDALPDSEFNQLKAQLLIVKEAINKARFRVAFAAVESHKSSSSFGSWQFLQDRQNADDLGMLDDFQKNCITDWVNSGSGAIQHQMQGRWEVVLNGVRFEYSFKLSGTVTWRDLNNPGYIGGEGSWTVTPGGVMVQWPKTGTIETFMLPINTDTQKARCAMKTGTFDMTARKTNPYP